MRRAATAGVPFLGIGAEFSALGATGRTPFVAIGIVFLVIGIALMARGRKTGGP